MRSRLESDSPPDDTPLDDRIVTRDVGRLPDVQARKSMGLSDIPNHWNLPRRCVRRAMERRNCVSLPNSRAISRPHCSQAWSGASGLHRRSGLLCALIESDAQEFDIEAAEFVFPYRSDLSRDAVIFGARKSSMDRCRATKARKGLGQDMTFPAVFVHQGAFNHSPGTEHNSRCPI